MATLTTLIISSLVQVAFSAIAASLQERQKQKITLEIPSSAYGAGIPIIINLWKLPGNMIDPPSGIDSDDGLWSVVNREGKEKKGSVKVVSLDFCHLLALGEHWVEKPDGSYVLLGHQYELIEINILDAERDEKVAYFKDSIPNAGEFLKRVSISGERMPPGELLEDYRNYREKNFEFFPGSYSQTPWSVAEHNYSHPDSSAQSIAIAYQGQSYIGWEAFNLKDFGNNIPNIYYTLLSTVEYDLATLVLFLSQKAGFDPSQLDVTELSGITVRGMFIANNGETAASHIEELQAAFFFFKVEKNGVIIYKLRDRPLSEPVLDLDYADFMEPPKRVRLSDFGPDRPTQVVLEYWNFNTWEQGAASSDPVAAAANTNVQTLSLPIALTESEAKAIADRWLAIQNIAFSRSYTFRLPLRFRNRIADGFLVRLPWGDVVQIEKITFGADLSVEVEATFYEKEAIGDPATLTRDFTVSRSLLTQRAPDPARASNGTPTNANLYALDIQLPPGGSPQGGVYFFSDRDRTILYADVGGYQQVGEFATASTIGTCQGALPAIANTNLQSADLPLLDTTSTLTFSVDSGSFPGANSAGFEALTTLCFVGRLVGPRWVGESIAYRDLTDNEDGTFTIAHLYRGLGAAAERGGSEHAIAGHQPGEKIFWMRGSLLRLSEFAIDFLGTTVSFKLQIDRSNHPSQELTNLPAYSVAIAGESYRPLASVDVAGETDATGNLLVTWQGRARGEHTTGDVPARYRVDLLSSSGDGSGSVVLSKTVGEPRATFGAGELASAGIPANPDAIVYRLSDLLVLNPDGFPAPAYPLSIGAGLAEPIFVGEGYFWHPNGGPIQIAELPSLPDNRLELGDSISVQRGAEFFKLDGADFGSGDALAIISVASPRTVEDGDRGNILRSMHAIGMLVISADATLLSPPTGFRFYVSRGAAGTLRVAFLAELKASSVRYDPVESYWFVDIAGVEQGATFVYDEGSSFWYGWGDFSEAIATGDVHTLKIPASMPADDSMRGALVEANNPTGIVRLELDADLLTSPNGFVLNCFRGSTGFYYVSVANSQDLKGENVFLFEGRKTIAIAEVYGTRTLIYNAQDRTWRAIGGATEREFVGQILASEDVTLHVDFIAGDNANTGLEPSAPLADLQTAIDKLARDYNLGGHQGTIAIAAGTSTLSKSILLKEPVGATAIEIVGSGFDGVGATILDGQGIVEIGIRTLQTQRFTIKNLKLQNFTISGVRSEENALVQIENIHLQDIYHAPLYCVADRSSIVVGETLVKISRTTNAQILYGILVLAGNASFKANRMTLDASGTDFRFGLLCAFRMGSLHLVDSNLASDFSGNHAFGSGVAWDGILYLNQTPSVTRISGLTTIVGA